MMHVLSLLCDDRAADRMVCVWEVEEVDDGDITCHMSSVGVVGPVAGRSCRISVHV